MYETGILIPPELKPLAQQILINVALPTVVQNEQQKQEIAAKMQEEMAQQQQAQQQAQMQQEQPQGQPPMEQAPPEMQQQEQPQLQTA